MAYGLSLLLVALVSYSIANAVLSGHAPAKSAGHGKGGEPAGHEVAPVATAPTSYGVRTDTESGAATAAAHYLELLDDASPSGTTSQELRALTLPPLTQEAIRGESLGAAIKQRLNRAGRAFVAGWRLGWRAVSYAPAAAHIAVWAMGMVQSRGEVVAAQYSTTFCWLRWTDGRWKVFAARTVDGPSPAIDGSDPSVVVAFVREANRFRPFTDAP